MFEEEPGGGRPEAFAEPRPHEQVPRHEQLADFAPMVQVLDVPGPQTVDHLVDVLMLFDAAIPEQVVAVPKISCPSRPLRALAATQMAEKPTDVVLVVDSPVLGARGSFGYEGNRVFLSFLSSRSLTFQCLVMVPLDMEVFKVFTQDSASHCLLSSRSLAFQFPVAVFKIFSQARVQQLLPQFCPKSRFKGFFYTLPRRKSAELPGR